MADRITANLPSRNFADTSAFYNRLGFAQSWFSACLCLDNTDSLHSDWEILGLPDDAKAIPRPTEVTTLPDTPRMLALIDSDRSPWRCLENGGD